MMRGSCTVALVGFCSQEALTLESFLHLADRPAPGFRVQDEVLDAQILIVNADSPPALHLVRHAELSGRVLLIGNADGGTGWPLQRRPVNRVAVLAELARLVVAPPAPAASPRRRSRDTELQPTQAMRQAHLARPPFSELAAALTSPPPLLPWPARRAAPALNQRPGVARTDWGALDELPMSLAQARPSRRSGDPPGSLSQRLSPEAPASPRGEVLLVAEGLVEGRVLFQRFKRYGLAVDWAHEPTHALEMLNKHPYRLVAIDRLSGQPDAFQVCRAAKQDQREGRAPAVVLFAAIAGSMDRMEADQAGCDACLSHSVGEADFYRLLAQHRLVSLDARARTDMGV